MRRRRLAALAVIAGLLLAACQERRHESEPEAAPVRSGSEGFADLAFTEFAALKDSVTPIFWLQSHAADTLVAFSPALDQEHQENWCVRATADIALPGGDTLRRAAYFYAPDPPATLALPPTADSAQLVHGHCLLGAIWVETPVLDSIAGYRLGHAVEQTLTKMYGTVKVGPHPLPVRAVTDSQRRALDRFGGFEALRMGLSFPGSANWRVPGRWEVAATTIVSAYDPRLSGRERPRVLAAAYLPRSRFDLDSRPDIPDYGAAEREEDSLLADAAPLTGLDAGMTAALLSLRTRQVPDSTRIAALRRWLATADAIGTVHRAAALLLADAVVPSALDHADSVRGKAYGDLGAEFVYSELDASYNYTHSLLEQARQLDPDGPVGRLVRLQLLRNGFNTNGMCGGGMEAFRQVISEGEALLEGLTAGARQAELHFLVGDAYADIVALAAGAGRDYADSGTYRGEAPAARLKAVEQYRAGLALDRTSARARAAWLEGWRLLAGLPPTTTHFFCVYD